MLGLPLMMVLDLPASRKQRRRLLVEMRVLAETTVQLACMTPMRHLADFSAAATESDPMNQAY